MCVHEKDESISMQQLHMWVIQRCSSSLQQVLGGMGPSSGWEKKQPLIRAMQPQHFSDEDIKKYLDDNPEQLQCRMCNSQCHPGSKYQTFSVSPSTCMSALLCEKVHIPDFVLSKLDINFNPVPGEVNEFLINPENFCFASNIHAKRSHDLTCTFPKTHKYEVHHITHAPKFVTIEEI